MDQGDNSLSNGYLMYKNNNGFGAPAGYQGGGMVTGTTSNQLALQGSPKFSKQQQKYLSNHNAPIGALNIKQYATTSHGNRSSSINNHRLK